MGPQNLFFGKSNPLMEKLLNFATRRFMHTMFHIFLLSFIEITKVEVIKPVHGIHQEKG